MNMETKVAPSDETPIHARAVKGNNNPPTLSEQALLDATEALKPLFDRAKTLIAAAGAAKADDADQAGKCADLVKMIRACDKEIEDKRKEVAKPYDDSVKLIRDLPKAIANDLDDAKTTVTKLIEAFDKKERERLAQEAAAKADEERKQQIALEERASALGVELPAVAPVRVAAAKPVRTVSSDLGTGVHTRKHKVYSVTNVYALPLEVLSHERVQDAIISVAREMMNADPNLTIKGILVENEDRVVVK